MEKRLKHSFLSKLRNFIKNRNECYPNVEIFLYHFLKAVKKLLIKIRINNPVNNNHDMFDWSLYNIHYRGEIKKDAKQYTLKLNAGDYHLIDSELKQINKKIKPIHYNWRLIYETILQLNPVSVLELGCGNGMHLYNIHVLNPAIELFGLDRSQKQIDYLHESYPELPARVKLYDATVSFLPNISMVELAFTQAVIMHIHTNDSHKTALANLFGSSVKYVLLMEKWKNHDFMNDIKELWTKKIIKWDKLFFYYKTSEITKKPHLMICSSEPLDYSPLTDYKIMLDN